jgi:uncharacterized membrane protein
MDDTPQGPQESAPPPPPPEPPPQEPAAKEVVSDNRTIMIVLSYFGILALIPFLVEKDDREVQWHAKHGLVLFGAEFVVVVGLFIIGALVTAISSGLGCLFGFVWPLFALAALIVHILCMVKGINGQRFLIPGVSEFADKF